MLGRIVLLRLVVVCAVIATLAEAQGGEPAPKPKPCSAITYVGVELNNPFTAQRVIRSKNQKSGETQSMPDLSESVARDSAGKIRIEHHPFSKLSGGSEIRTLHQVDGTEMTLTQEELSRVITIFDCSAGHATTVQPGMRIAWIRPFRSGQPAARGELSYSRLFMSTLRSSRSAELVGEDLGYKTIDGIQARGIRTTSLGKEEDEWKGKPISIWEQWVSDDLAATLLETHTDCKKGTESTHALIEVQREDPDPALFVIPANYKINPTRDEMPQVKPVTQPDPPH